MPFKPGVSGNPSGRPKGSAGFQSTCRDLADKYAIPLFEKLVRGEPVEVTVIRKGKKVKLEKYPDVEDMLNAARWLTDRGYGKAMNTNKLVGGGDEDPSGDADAIERARKRVIAALKPKKVEGANGVSDVSRNDDET